MQTHPHLVVMALGLGVLGAIVVTALAAWILQRTFLIAREGAKRPDEPAPLDD